MPTRGAFVHIVSNESHTLYTGMSSEEKRLTNGFTARDNVDRVVYFEWLPSSKESAAREKEIKGWRREKTVALIQSRNPNWDDLSRELGRLLKLD